MQMMHPFSDPNHKYSLQLFTAVTDRDIAAVQRFIQKGAKANVVCGDADGRTAIGMACALGEDEILQILLRSLKHPNTNRTVYSGTELDNINQTPEGMDELEWEDEFQLTKNKNSNNEADEGTALYYYYAKTLEVTGSILSSIKMGFYGRKEEPEDPHVADDTLLMTPLHYAAGYGHSNCVDILLKTGCKVNPINAAGYTPLHLGTKFYDVSLKLLQNGADCTMHALYTFDTPLHMAVRHRNLDVVKLISSQKHCNINALNSDDCTALIYAIRLKEEDIALHFLLDKRTQINQCDNKGHNALFYAVTSNQINIAKRLLSRRARRLPEHYLLHSCVRSNFKEMVELLILQGDSLSMQNAEGHTPIMTAIACRNVEMLEFLLQIIKLNAQYDDNFYLGKELFMAVDRTNHLRDFIPLAKLLFSYSYGNATKSDFLLTSHENFCATALAHSIEQNKMHIAEYLIKEGIDGQTACNEHSLLHLSQLINEPGVVEFAKLLAYSGFKFKQNSSRIPNSLLELCKNPLSLKGLSRIVIRRCLTRKPFGNLEAPNYWEPVILSRIKKLGLPKPLLIYLYEFPDCPMNFSKDILKNINF